MRGFWAAGQRARGVRRGGGRTGGARGARGQAGGGEAGAGPAAPPNPGPGAGPGGASGVLAPCQFGCSDLLWPPRQRPATCGLPSPRPPAPRAAAARRAPPAASAPCPPAAWAPPPNPRGGHRRCCPYCFSASSGRRETDQEPVSTRRPAPPLPAWAESVRPGGSRGGGGAGRERRRHLDGRGTKEGAPGTALGAPSPAGRTAQQSTGLRVRLPHPRPYLGRRAEDARPGPRSLGGPRTGTLCVRRLGGRTQQRP